MTGNIPPAKQRQQGLVHVYCRHHGGSPRLLSLIRKTRVWFIAGEGDLWERRIRHVSWSPLRPPFLRCPAPHFLLYQARSFTGRSGGEGVWTCHSLNNHATHPASFFKPAWPSRPLWSYILYFARTNNTTMCVIYVCIFVTVWVGACVHSEWCNMYSVEHFMTNILWRAKYLSGRVYGHAAWHHPWSVLCVLYGNRFRIQKFKLFQYWTPMHGLYCLQQ